MTTAFATTRYEERASGFDIARGIRRVLEIRHAMQIGEIALCLGVEKDRIREELEEMMERNEAEKLRPVNYPFEDHDFFRLCGGHKTVVEACSQRNSVWIRSAPAAAQCA